VEHAPPLNDYVPALAASIVLPGHLLVYGFTVYSTKGSAQFVLMFDTGTLPGDGAVPIFPWPVAASNGVGFAFTPRGRQFRTGLVLCNSSTDATKTIGSADCFFDVQYDVLDPES
jgi:hypothetical protein